MGESPSDGWYPGAQELGQGAHAQTEAAKIPQHVTHQRTRAGSSLAGSRLQVDKALSCVDGDWLQTVPRAQRIKGDDLVKMP